MSSESSLSYKSFIIPRLHDEPLTSDEASSLDAPDRRDGRIYKCDDHLHLSVEVALATGRPLLLRGAPGSGKSSFAAYVARNLNYRYYEHIVSSQTNAQDLLWRFDLVRRLADAQARAGLSNPPPLNDFDYIEPGVLWWVFDRQSALNRGWSGAGLRPATFAEEPYKNLNNSRDADRAVVLIDEIDKADPDVPNALLVPLGSLQFDVTDVNVKVARKPNVLNKPTEESREYSRLLVVITTNEERELPAAFMRRCVVHRIEHPTWEQLVDIANLHFPDKRFTKDDKDIAAGLARKVEQLRKDRQILGKRPPGTAEFLDAVRACLMLGISVDDDSPTWKTLEQATLLKDEVAS